MDRTDALQRLARTWRLRVDGPVSLASFGLAVVTLVAGAHLARLGTAGARATAALLLATVLVWWLGRIFRDRRDWRTSAGVLRRVVLPVDRGLARRASRALGLVEAAELDPSVGSLELSRAHFERLVHSASEQAVARTARRHAWAWRAMAWLLLCAGVGALILRHDHVVQGLAVWTAQDNRASLQLKWLTDVRIEVRPPPYLRLSDERVAPGTEVEAFRGSAIVVRGFALGEPQRLVLTDGRREVSFASDGSSEVVATWRLQGSADLRVAARFGDVLLEEPDVLVVHAVADGRPEVTLHGAPRSIQLGEQDKIELSYDVVDDHGLSQVDLVVRSGERQQRRVLARLDGTPRRESGGTVIAANDSFFKRIFLPVSIVVEARDNDVLAGAKWGRSRPISVNVPSIGAPEARRLEQLRRATSTLAELLADTLVERNLASPTPEHGGLREGMQVAARALRRPLDKKHLGLPVPRGLATFLTGQSRRLELPVAGRTATLRRLEDIVLAVDVALQQLAVRDAVSVARRLADVAEETASGASQARTREDLSADLAYLESASHALREGARELAHLGDLGADLGSAAAADIRRLLRALNKRDVHDVELIAHHVARKLRRAGPSFAWGSGGGVEAGMGSTSGMQVQPSDADQRFDQLALELEQLIEEHAHNIGRVEGVVSDAPGWAQQVSWRVEATELAEKIRSRAQGLPRLADATSAGQEAALAREHAESMADALQDLALRDALVSGRDAVSALNRARGAQDASSDGVATRRTAIREAANVIAEAVRWVAERQRNMERMAAERARETLEQAARREHALADTSDRIASQGEGGEVVLPERIVQALRGAHSRMRGATRLLRARRTEKALGLQRQAQAMLEQARTGRTTEPAGAGGRGAHELSGVEAKGVRTNGMVEPNRSQDVAGFRQRVLEGLGQPKAERLAPAVRRYAEELLK